MTLRLFCFCQQIELCWKNAWIILFTLGLWLPKRNLKAAGREKNNGKEKQNHWKGKKFSYKKKLQDVGSGKIIDISIIILTFLTDCVSEQCKRQVLYNEYIWILRKREIPRWLFCTRTLSPRTDKKSSCPTTRNNISRIKEKTTCWWQSCLMNCQKVFSAQALVLMGINCIFHLYID